MGRLTEIVKSTFAKRSTAPGKSVIVQTKSSGDVQRTVELYHPPGISSAPTKGDRLIEIPLGSGVRVAVVTHNYRINVEVTAGETIIYSTNAAGDTVMSQIKLDTSGNIDLNGDGKKLVTHAELNTALQTFITALNLHVHGAAGTPPVTPMSLDIAEAATVTVRTDG